MKKLFALLLIAPMLFTACGDEEDEKPYFNPVEGTWVYSLPEYNYTTSRTFTKNFESFSVSIIDGKTTEKNWGKYSITKSEIKYEKWIHEYKIVKDTLWFWVKGEDIDLNEKYIKRK